LQENKNLFKIVNLTLNKVDYFKIKITFTNLFQKSIFDNSNEATRFPVTKL